MNFLRWARTQWDRVAAWVLIAVGGLALVLGWVGVADEPLTAQQIPYIVSGGVGGLFLLGLGGVLWLSADLRDEWRKLDAIERRQAAAAEAQIAKAPVDDPFAPSIDVAPDRPARAANGTRPLSAPRRARPTATKP